MTITDTSDKWQVTSDKYREETSTETKYRNQVQKPSTETCTRYKVPDTKDKYRNKGQVPSTRYKIQVPDTITNNSYCTGYATSY